MTASRGWAVACLDPILARITTTESETYGCTPKSSLGRGFIDNSDCALSLMDISQWHPGFSKFSTVPEPVANDDNGSEEEVEEMSYDGEPFSDGDDEGSSDESVEEEIPNEVAMMDQEIQVGHISDTGATSDTPRCVFFYSKVPLGETSYDGCFI